MKIKLKYTLVTILKVYGIILGLYLILEIIENSFGSVDFSIVKSNTNLLKSFEKYNLLLLALKTLIIAPVIEEFIFREPLKKSKIGNNILFFVFCYSMLIIIIKPSLNFYFLNFYAVVLLLFNNFVQKKKKYILFSLIFTSIVFSAFHINNVETIDNVNNWHLYIYKVFPFIILGYGLGKIRLKLNVIWSIIGHSFFNLIPFVFKYIF